MIDSLLFPVTHTLSLPIHTQASDMPSKSVKPSLYPPLPFHIIRSIAFLSAVIVAIILAVFIYNLHQAGYKLPWAFLVIIISALISILNFLLTTITHCAYGLSPRLSLTFNTLLLILWCISLGLLSWSMAHTILTACTATYWGNSTGITVCRIYKTLFAFTVAATGAAIAAVWLDIVVRRRETRFGVYGAMGSNTAFANEGDVKLQDRSSMLSTAPLGAGMRREEDAFNDVPDPDDVYVRRRGHSGSGDGGDAALLDEYRGDAGYGHADGYGYGYAGDAGYGGSPAWGQPQHGGGYGGGYVAYPGFQASGTAYDPGAYR